jgi:hypothetical protein
MLDDPDVIAVPPTVKADASVTASVLPVGTVIVLPELVMVSNESVAAIMFSSNHC